ncbi:14943_t:CDS:2, partial [Gigaspora margarita]
RDLNYKCQEEAILRGKDRKRNKLAENTIRDLENSKFVDAYSKYNNRYRIYQEEILQESKTRLCKIASRYKKVNKEHWIAYTQNLKKALKTNLENLNYKWIVIKSCIIGSTKKYLPIKCSRKELVQGNINKKIKALRNAIRSLSSESLEKFGYYRTGNTADMDSRNFGEGKKR